LFSFSQSARLISDKYGMVALQFLRVDRHPVLVLNYLVVQNKGQGKGTEAINLLTDLCDKFGVELQLQPKPIKTIKETLNTQQLISFYEKAGFVITYDGGGSNVIMEYKPIDNIMKKDLTKKDIEYLSEVIDSQYIPDKWKKKASEMVEETKSESKEIKSLELEKTKLVNKAFKTFANSKKQLEIRKQIKDLDNKIKQLKDSKTKPSSEKQQLEEALKGIQVAIDLAGETEELLKAKKGIEIAINLI
jgi:hypothetical protein